LSHATGSATVPIGRSIDVLIALALALERAEARTEPVALLGWVRR
jgi:hypothetical protein